MIRLPVAIALSIAIVSEAHAQERVTLAPGDKIPSLKGSTWLKGAGPKRLEKGIIVVDLWATWCAPCIEMFPELSQIAEQNPDIYVAGMSVLERDLPLDKLKRFVKSKSADMRFNIAADTEGVMQKSWVNPAAVRQLPTTFVAKNGIIQWIGHPEQLKTILPAVRSGTFDVASERNKYIETGNRGLRERAFTELLYAIDSQLDLPDATAGIKAFEKLQRDYPEFKSMTEDWRIKYLLRTEPKAAEDLMASLYENSKFHSLAIGLTYVRFKSEIAHRAAVKLLETEGIKHPMTYFFLANFFVIAKSKAEALKATDLARIAYKAMGKENEDIVRNIEMKRKQAEELPGLH